MNVRDKRGNLLGAMDDFNCPGGHLVLHRPIGPWTGPDDSRIMKSEERIFPIYDLSDGRTLVCDPADVSWLPGFVPDFATATAPKKNAAGT